ncbi:hypothetical protein AVEN_96762-1 [Araneus ventricosus]|uniref:Uncharacterized protein n=1 Tax=Araneus ventricosus TaxID=182803 RepID=A0A4Y2VSV6_ARAVE|nr:hypothetical protein AVEN_96762-1 [Araneus ventricosus]
MSDSCLRTAFEWNQISISSSLIHLVLQSPDRSRADSADVRRQEHDGGVRPAARALPDGGHHLPGPHVHEGGGRADAERAEQEQQLLRRVDPEQRENGRLRHPSQGPQDVRHLHRKQHRHPGTLQEDIRTVHRWVHSRAIPFVSPSMWVGHSTQTANPYC